MTMTITVNTKIAALIKQHPDALEAVINVHPRFEKLRNPLLRKIMAGRTSISMASKISGCSVTDFFRQLKPLGFEIDSATEAAATDEKQLPDFILFIKKYKVIDLDVRPVITSGQDPLATIIKKVKTIQPGQILKIVNSFYPEPLILLLENQGFTAYADVIDDNLVETYFYKGKEMSETPAIKTTSLANGWEEILKRFENKIEEMDVRALEMPRPMLAILDALEKLPAETALFVHHKRIPVFLLPELSDRKFEYLIKEISEGDVKLLIYKD
jgi:uncharacterized protein (DUF2249 family)